MSTLATLAFIGAAAAVGGYLAQRPTVMDGTVIAGDLLEQLRSRGISEITCDPEIPIGRDGATFQCVARRPDGSTATVEYTMDREMKLGYRLMDASGPTQPRVPASGDPWGD